jgi:DNA-binding NarL/FixJ family response regulator
MLDRAGVYVRGHRSRTQLLLGSLCYGIGEVWTNGSAADGKRVRPYSPDVPADVLIADHALIRLGIKVALESEDSVRVAAEAGTADEAVLKAERVQPDVCLVGWDLPGGALTAIQRIFLIAPASAVVVMASTNSVDDLLAALRAGAIGYVPNNASTEGLRRVLRAVLVDEAAVPRSMVRDLILEIRSSTLGRGKVTDREAEVLSMLRRGLSTGEIAQRLHISPVTVRRHISDLVHKLDVRDRSALREVTPRDQPPDRSSDDPAPR